MKTIFISLAALTLLLAPASGRSKASKQVPQVSPTPFIVSHITLDARNTAAGRAQGPGVAPSADETRVTTSHEATIEITVVNIGTMPEEVALHWFWVGRYEKSKNWFRSGDGTKTLTINPQQSQVVLAESGEIEGHKTTGKEHFKSGGNMLGWIVTASDRGGEILATKASDPLYEGFAQSPPAKARR